jgi:hypothetical protein
MNRYVPRRFRLEHDPARFSLLEHDVGPICVAVGRQRLTSSCQVSAIVRPEV